MLQINATQRMRIPRNRQLHNNATPRSQWATLFATAAAQWAALENLLSDEVRVGDEDAPAMTEEQRERFVCPICLNYMEVPLETPCGHTFCGSCLSQLALAHRSQLSRQPQHDTTTTACPLCRAPFEGAAVKIADGIFREMLECRIACACNSRFSPLHSRSHAEHCPVAIIYCSHHRMGCTFTSARDKMPDHLPHCPYEAVKGLWPAVLRILTEQLNPLERRISGVSHHAVHQANQMQNVTRQLQELIVHFQEFPPTGRQASPSATVSSSQRQPDAQANIKSFWLQVLWRDGGLLQVLTADWKFPFTLATIHLCGVIFPLILLLLRLIILSSFQMGDYYVYCHFVALVSLLCTLPGMSCTKFNPYVLLCCTAYATAVPQSILPLFLVPTAWILAWVVNFIQLRKMEHAASIASEFTRLGYIGAAGFKIFWFLVPRDTVISADIRQCITAASVLLLWMNPAASIPPLLWGHGRPSPVLLLFAALWLMCGAIGGAWTVLLTVNSMLSLHWFLQALENSVHRELASAITHTGGADAPPPLRYLLGLSVAAYCSIFLPWN